MATRRKKTEQTPAAADATKKADAPTAKSKPKASSSRSRAKKAAPAKPAAKPAPKPAPKPAAKPATAALEKPQPAKPAAKARKPAAKKAPAKPKARKFAFLTMCPNQGPVVFKKLQHLQRSGAPWVQLTDDEVRELTRFDPTTTAVFGKQSADADNTKR